MTDDERASALRSLDSVQLAALVSFIGVLLGEASQQRVDHLTLLRRKALDHFDKQPHVRIVVSQ